MEVGIASLFIAPNNSKNVFAFSTHNFEFACSEGLVTMVLPSGGTTAIPILEAEFAT